MRGYHGRVLMSVKRALVRTRRIRTPVLPIAAIFVYALLGTEFHFFVWLAILWPNGFHPEIYHVVPEFWWDGYVFSWSVPEMLLAVHLLALIYLWCTWRGWLATHGRSGRPAAGAALAFLSPALVLAIFSWILTQSMDLPLPFEGYSVQRIEGTAPR